MKTLYQASNSLEAHMIQDLLKMEGIAARIDGEYLQGGMGELPAAGLVRVMVDEQDYQAAKVIVDRWDAAQPPQLTSPSTVEPVRKFPIFLAGIVVGFLLAMLIA
jgi:hypothetical protein